MAFFRYFKKQGIDRSAGDRRRHRELVRKAIKENVGNVVSEESIIGRSGDKKIKIPIKGIKEYRFVFGENNPGVAEGDGESQPGQIVQKGKESQKSLPGEPGSTPGDDVYETEITLEELVDLLFEDLKLPDMERKKFHILQSERRIKNKGYRHKGIRPHLSKKRTVINKLKRKKTLEKAESNSSSDDGEERFPFHERDLRYHYKAVKEKKFSNAVVLCMMDTSGSMDTTKKYLARSFYFLLYQFLKTRYQNVAIVFISHHTEAKEVNEDEFFHRGESGGTMISSGYKKALEIIENRYNPALWNVYAFHCSDGDNFSSDNPEALRYAKELAEVCNLFGYGEIKPAKSFSWSSMLDLYKEIKNENFVTVMIRSKEELWPAFQKFLKHDQAEGEVAVNA
jgi:sporulation protein YhbH